MLSTDVFRERNQDTSGGKSAWIQKVHPSSSRVFQVDSLFSWLSAHLDNSLYASSAIIFIFEYYTTPHNPISFQAGVAEILTWKHRVGSGVLQYHPPVNVRLYWVVHALRTYCSGTIFVPDGSLHCLCCIPQLQALPTHRGLSRNQERG